MIDCKIQKAKTSFMATPKGRCDYKLTAVPSIQRQQTFLPEPLSPAIKKYQF